MKCRHIVMIAAACLLLAGNSAASETGELDEHLRFLQPLTGHEWEGGYVGEHAHDIVIFLRFEPILSGSAVKYTRAAAAADFLSETYFYWSPSRNEVRFISLNSRGTVGEGVVTQNEGEILLQGQYERPDGAIEFRTVLRLDAEGVLHDTYTRMEAGEWVQGHFQEFTAKQEQ